MLSSNPRVRLVVPAFLALVLLYFLFSGPSADSISRVASSYGYGPKKASRTLHVSIVNAPRYHFEVVLPLLHTFSQQGHIKKLDLIAEDSSSKRFGALKFLKGVMEPSSLGPLTIKDPKTINATSGWNPDVMVLTSCMHDISANEHVANAVDRVLTSNPRSTAICILHEVREWEKADSKHRKFAHKWANNGRVKFMVLSQHVANSLRSKLPVWGMESAEILPIFVPVFPLSNGAIGFDSTKPQQKSIGIPGKYEPWRRSYTPIFTGLDPHAPKLKDMDFGLHLVGFGDHPSPIPPSINEMVHFHDNENFDAYWRVLRRTLAIATAFANDHYITDQASSTVATALIVGVPLICGKEVLDAYTYISEDEVWLLNEGEGVADGFMRVLELSPGVWQEKRNRVEERRQELERENIKWVDTFLGTRVKEIAKVAAEVVEGSNV
ncbi:hypothetical protein K402DRAFT_418939 [Aulographum hederae CBS 113979]|uniref:Glycosyltransferase family 1 protein n=1 Tax=Aulographum hederae CBS 113979 TaxID=1176131 RepID=A0A6G1H7B1_9PEZI|nr:hypothetical protein K402DRAFT_418939 [Aulographum hederae CBS 113979]